LELLELKAKTREQAGKGHAHALRQQGRVPAVLYGPDTEVVSLSVSAHDLELLLKKSDSRQQLVNLSLEEGGAARSAMIKELQTHPLSDALLHVDFYEVAMDRKIRVRVPVVVTGDAIGVEMGGMLQIVRRELEVLSLPLEVPESIVIDITGLDIGDSVHVNEIPLEGDIEIPADVNFTVLTVLSPKMEAEPEEEEDELGEGEEAAEGEEAEDEEKGDSEE
jgi:large subunit ribosomal protein L25